MNTANARHYCSVASIAALLAAVLLTVTFTSSSVAQDMSSKDRCDTLAAYQFDPFRKAEPVPDHELKVDEVIRYCRNALEQAQAFEPGEKPRLMMQLMRGLAANKNDEEFRKLALIGYKGEPDPAILHVMGLYYASQKNTLNIYQAVKVFHRCSKMGLLDCSYQAGKIKLLHANLLQNPLRAFATGIERELVVPALLNYADADLYLSAIYVLGFRPSDLEFNHRMLFVSRVLKKYSEHQASLNEEQLAIYQATTALFFAEYFREPDALSQVPSLYAAARKNSAFVIREFGPRLEKHLK